MRLFLLATMLLCPLLATAQLAVTISSPKIVGQKAVVRLTMQNNLSEKVESARAAVFLSDEHGRVVGQSAKWVIGSEKYHAALNIKRKK